MVIADVREECIASLYAALWECCEGGGKLLLFGCGGSASNASHIASQFMAHWTDTSLPALALTADPAVLTAIANERGFDEVFSRQVAVLGRRGDFVIGLSASGVAPAVSNGLARAHAMGIQTSGWTGAKGLPFARATDFPIVVNRTWAGTIRERHLELGHLLSDAICNQRKSPWAVAQ